MAESSPRATSAATGHTRATRSALPRGCCWSRPQQPRSGKVSHRFAGSAQASIILSPVLTGRPYTLPKREKAMGPPSPERRGAGSDLFLMSCMLC